MANPPAWFFKHFKKPFGVAAYNQGGNYSESGKDNMAGSGS
jgi:hypothetical protein